MAVITPKAILSYPHLHKPQDPKPGQDPKYSATLVFVEGTDTTALQQAAIAAASDKFPSGYKLPNGQVITIQQAFAENILRSPFRKDALAKGYPSGSIFINVRTTKKPAVVYAQAGANGKPVPMPEEKMKDELYPGAIVRASVAAFYYDRDGNKGVSFALNNIQKLADGDRLDGRVAAEDEFDADLSQPPADIAGLV